MHAFPSMFASVRLVGMDWKEQTRGRKADLPFSSRHATQRLRLGGKYHATLQCGKRNGTQKNRQHEKKSGQLAGSATT